MNGCDRAGDGAVSWGRDNGDHSQGGGRGGGGSGLGLIRDFRVVIDRLLVEREDDPEAWGLD